MSHFSAADVHLGHLGIFTYSNASYSVRAQKEAFFAQEHISDDQWVYCHCLIQSVHA